MASGSAFIIHSPIAYVAQGERSRPDCVLKVYGSRFSGDHSLVNVQSRSVVVVLTTRMQRCAFVKFRSFRYVLNDFVDGYIRWIGNYFDNRRCYLQYWKRIRLGQQLLPNLLKLRELFAMRALKTEGSKHSDYNPAVFITIVIILIMLLIDDTIICCFWCM